jgi:plastocyanin
MPSTADPFPLTGPTNEEPAVNRLTLTACLLVLAACGKTDAPAPATTEGPAATAAPAVTGATIEIKTVTDEKGSRFEPASLKAHTGDVLRFVLVSGVHNVSWPADKNPAGATLPPVGDMMQLPGQTYDLTVNLPAGTYHFQCDPHAALGMVGELVVE